MPRTREAGDRASEDRGGGRAGEPMLDAGATSGAAVAGAGPARGACDDEARRTRARPSSGLVHTRRLAMRRAGGGGRAECMREREGRGGARSRRRRRWPTPQRETK